MDNVLIHHGTKGMKWGVRRYQNKDGSLTPAGKRKYGTKTNFEKVQAIKRAGIKKNTVDKERDKANVRTEKEISKLKKKYGLNDDKQTDVESKPKTKSVKEMSDDELREHVYRMELTKRALDLDKQLSSLEPKHVSAGKQFIDSVGKDVLSPVAKNVGKQYLEKVLKDKLGINEKNGLDGLKKEVEKLRLEKERKDLKNPKKDPYKEMQEAIKNHSTKKAYDKMQEELKREQESKENTNDKKETYSGTVEGEGTSRYKEPKGPTVDGKFRDVSYDDPDFRRYQSDGESIVSQFLLEDKHNR